MPVLTFDDFHHKYMLDGKPLPSVTSVISNVTEDLLLNSNFIRAGARGTIVHGICEKLNNGEKVNLSELPEDINRYVQGYISFLNSGDYHVTHSEIRVYSVKYRYAGTVDIIGKNRKGQDVVMDIKTSAMVSPTASLQMAAYGHAIEEMRLLGPKTKIKERVVIWLTGDGNYQLVPYKDPTDMNTFVCKLVSFNWDKKNGMR